MKHLNTLQPNKTTPSPLIKHLALITLTGLLIYAKTLMFDFTYLDDQELILQNLTFLTKLSNLPNAFLHDVFLKPSNQAYYRPLLTISFMLDAQLSGSSPFLYHLTNIILHLLSSGLLYLLLNKISRNPKLSLTLSLIFTVHPVLSQTVAWIPGRNDTLLALFTLSSFITLIYFLETKSAKYLITHLLLYSLALFTKETALLLPLLFLAYTQFLSPRKLHINFKQYLILGWLTLPIPWLLLRRLAFTNPTPYSLSDYLQSIFNNSPALLQLLGKTFFPLNLSVLPTIQDTTFLYGLIALPILIAIILFSKNKSLSLFGLTWFILLLVPSLIRPDPTGIADFIEHRLYLPFIGLLLAFIPVLQKPSRKTAFLILFLPVTLSLSLLNLRHTSNFKDRLTFWQNAVSTSPNHPLAHRNLGAMYYLAGNLEQASVEYKKSLSLNPEEKMAHNNLGLIYMDKKMYQEAETEFMSELEVNPAYDLAHFNLGLLYYQTGQIDKARKHWTITIELNPQHNQARQNLQLLNSQLQQ